MIRRPGLWLKMLLVAFLNVFLLLTFFLIVARVQFRLDLGSFLLAPARYRMLSISRLAALELSNMPRERWSGLLKQYSSAYPAEFFLFDREGTELAGETVHPPDTIFKDQRRWRNRVPSDGAYGGPDIPHRTLNNSVSEDRGPWRPRGGALARPPARDFSPLMGSPPDRFAIEFAHTSNPAYYWAAMRVPVSLEPGQRPLDARMVWRFESLWTDSFFFDYKPWFIGLLLIAVVSVACWLPLIRSLTRTISAVTAATGRIADGHFEVTLPVRRRDELGRLSESINQMAHRLSSYVNGQRRFLGDIAHELCSPVARIQFALGILENRASANDRRYVETIDEEVQHMSSLVNELLSFSKASLGAPAVLEDVNVSESVERAIEREATENVVVTCSIPPMLSVTAHRDYLVRSLSNVLRNAVRYAGSDGPIVISATRVQSIISISIADHGPGVPPAELEEILKPFYRPEAARQRETGGVGLGLAIVRTCMEACGGSVVCRNRSPRGFEVELRLRAAPSTLEESTSPKHLLT